MSILKLIKSHIPITEKLKVIKGIEYGGIKLVYNTVINNKLQQIVYLKPFKELWASSKEDCLNKNEWGNKLSPYCNVWIKLNEYPAYTNFTIVKEHSLIKALNSKEKYILMNNQTISSTNNIKYILNKLKSYLTFK